MTSPHIRMERKKKTQKHEFRYLRSLQEDLSLLFVFPLFLNSLQLLKKTKLGANVRRLFVIFFILDRGGRKEGNIQLVPEQAPSRRRAACAAEACECAILTFPPSVRC